MSSMPPPPPPPPPPPSPVGGTDGYVNTTVANRAGFGARLGGHILDGLLYGLLASVFIIPGAIMVAAGVKTCAEKVDAANGAEVTCTSSDINGGLLGGGLAILFIGAIVVAFVYLRALGKTGQTWGRKIVGVKVVRQQDGAPLGFGLAFGRTVLEQILGQLCLLNYLWMLWDAEKQTWHDKIVHSVVIKV